MYLIQDVTTRGAYYPDKSMATPAVSVLKNYFSVIFVTNDIIEPSALPSHHKYHQGRP